MSVLAPSIHSCASLATGTRLPRLHLLSDVHLETGPYELPPDLDFDILVAAGDIGPVEQAVQWLASLNKPVVYVLGNHEYWGGEMDDVLARAKAAAAGTQVRVLERQSAVIHGVRFLGATLWSSFGNGHRTLLQEASQRMRDYKEISAPRWYDVKANVAWMRGELKRLGIPQGAVDRVVAERRFHPLIAWQLHRRAVDWLERGLGDREFEGPTVVVTHHAPSFRSLRAFGVRNELLDPKNWDRRSRDDDLVRVAAYASDLDPLLEYHHARIDCWMHGHLHAEEDQVVEGVRVLCNPRGYAEHPLTEADATFYAAYGLGLSGEDIVRSQAHHAENPFEGNGLNFDRRLVVDFAEGFRRPYARATASVLDDLREILADARELRPLYESASGKMRECVARCLREDCDQFAASLDKLKLQCGLTRRVLTAVFNDLKMPHQRPWAPFFSPDEEMTAAQAFDQPLGLMEEWIRWAEGLPTSARRSLARWLHDARRGFDYLAAQGFDGAVVRALQVERLRHPQTPHLHFGIDADEAVCRDLGVRMDKLFNPRTPRHTIIDVRTPEDASYGGRDRTLDRAALDDALRCLEGGESEP